MIKIKEGDVVVFQSKPKPGQISEEKVGTVFQATNGVLLVLDSEGLMHIVKDIEVYLHQE